MPATTDVAPPRPERLRTIPQLLAERPALRSDGKEPGRWVRRLVHERRLASYRVGGRVLIDLDEADRLLTGNHRDVAS